MVVEVAQCWECTKCPRVEHLKMVKITFKKIIVHGHWVVSPFGIVNGASVNVGVQVPA